MRRVGVAAAAKMLDYSERTVRRLIAEGKIPAQRIGRHGHWKIAVEDLERLRNSAKSAEPAEPT